MSCGVGHRLGLDLALLWLWCRPAAVATIRLLAWEPPYAAGAALKIQKKKKKKKIGVLPFVLFIKSIYAEYACPRLEGNSAKSHTS